MTPHNPTPSSPTTPLKTPRQNRTRLVQLVLVFALLIALIGNSAGVGVNAQDDPSAQPATAEESVIVTEEEPTEMAPVLGALQLALSGSNGAALAGAFAVTDAAGNYIEVQVNGGYGWAEPLSPGPASVTQIFATTDYQAAPSTVVTIPEGDAAYLQIVNVFMDADGDTVGDSVDVCALGNDFVDTDGDTIPDACDPTPVGEPTATPTPIVILTTPILGDPPLSATAEPINPIPTEASPISDESPVSEASPATEEGESAVVVEISDEEIVVESSSTSCVVYENAAPRVSSDLADYAPGSLVTLTGDGWVPGQVVEIVVDDDGVADAERGPWELRATATADAQGNLFYQFSIAPWYVAQYTVVVTGECSEARTDFTDSVSAGPCVQVSATDSVAVGDYVMFRCTSPSSPFKPQVPALSAGWQWAFIYSDAPSLTPPAFGSLAWNTTTIPSDTSASGGIQQAYLFLSPTASVPTGSTGSATVEFLSPNGNTLYATSILLGKRVGSNASFQMSCTPSSTAVTVPAALAVWCTLSATSLESGTSVPVTIPTLSAPAGWTATAPSPSSGTITAATPFSFSVTFTSSCLASTSAQPVSVNSNLTLNGVATAGPSSSVALARASGTTASVAITSSSLSWTRAYSMGGYASNSGSISYRVQAEGCAGWNVTVSSTNFTSSDPNGAPPISAENLKLTGSTLPSGTGISAPATSGALSSALRVLSASPSSGVGTYEQTLDLNLSVPAGTLVGQYQASVTIAITTGP